MLKRRRKKPNQPVDDVNVTRRVFVLGAAQGALGCLLASRLVELGIFDASKYTSLSEKNRVKMQVIIPRRGEIYDRTGIKIALNQPSFALVMTPELCPSPKDTIHYLANLLSWEEENTTTAFKNLKNNPRFYPLVLDRQVSWDNLCRIAIHQQELEGCEIQEGFTRHYPFENQTAHVLGYVQTPSMQEKKENDLFRLADFRIGKVGIEKFADGYLLGTPGYKQMEVNARNRWVRDIDVIDSKEGSALNLTLSMELQSFLAKRLEGFESASAVVLDARNGHVLALHAQPGFNPNYFINGISTHLWKDLMDNPYRPMHNKAIQGTYPPGSIFKTIVALAAFESGLVSPKYSTYCHGYMEVGNHRFHCHNKNGHGHVDIIHGLRQSCDIYFYELAKAIGIDRISTMAKHFGLGSPTGIELPGEASGLVPTKSWKKIFRNQSWTLGDTVQVGIGQGALLASPIQLATAIASIVNPQGQIIRPTLFKDSPRPIEPHGIDPKYIALVHQGLVDTVNSPQGIAYRLRIEKEGFEFAGKTSTAQVRRISMDERRRGVLKNEQRPWHHRDHAMFAGYAPIHDPRYVVAVVVEHGGGGSRIAAPVGREVLLKAQELNI